jgi:hypothetical protein
MTCPGASAADAPTRDERRSPRDWWCAIAVMLPMSGAVASLVVGTRTLFFRDILNLHLTAKLAQLAAWREGRLPLVDTFRSGGQPSLGNLNTLPLYPDNLLYLVADSLWALNAHFWLHLLVAPLASYWLGRVFGLSRPAAWAVAATYSFSGAFLSAAGFYNLVPAAALAPALVAAALQTSRGSVAPVRQSVSKSLLAGAGSALLLSVLWCLLLLGGDPMLAMQALAAACLAVLLDPTPRSFGARRLPAAVLARGARLLPALGAGTLLALPQLVGFAQTLGFSYRGYIGFVAESSLVASWDPRQLLEWLMPLAFGSPQLGFWGGAFSGGQLPLYFSVHPGLLALALVLTAGRPRDPRAWWAVATTAAGLFFALGEWNPVVRLLARLPGADLLRFPVKFYLWITLGAALLAGLGLERALRGGSRQLVRALGIVRLLELACLAVLVQVPERVETWLTAAGDLSAAKAALVRRNWTAAAGGLSFFALVLGAIALALRRWPARAVVLLLALHATTQMLWLWPALLPTDEAAFYRGRPPLLGHFEPGETIAHGGYGELFGPARNFSPPDRRLLWVQRRGFLELYPFTGVRFGREYELNVSAEGLDSFLTHLTFNLMRSLDDPARLRVLRTLGVEVLVLDRPLEPPFPAWVSERAVVGTGRTTTYLYDLEAAPELVIAGNVHRAAHVNASIAFVVDPRFDPATMAVVPGAGPGHAGPPGKVLEILVDEAERLEARVLAVGPSVLVVQRAYLPFYRAEVDGQPARLTAANLDRLGLELPAGEHSVRIWADRRPLAWSSLGVLAGVLVLLHLVWRAHHALGASPQPRQPSIDAGE